MSLPLDNNVIHWQEVPAGHATAHWHHLQGDEAALKLQILMLRVLATEDSMMSKSVVDTVQLQF